MRMISTSAGIKCRDFFPRVSATGMCTWVIRILCCYTSITLPFEGQEKLPYTWILLLWFTCIILKEWVSNSSLWRAVCQSQLGIAYRTLPVYLEFLQATSSCCCCLTSCKRSYPLSQMASAHASDALMALKSQWKGNFHFLHVSILAFGCYLFIYLEGLPVHRTINLLKALELLWLWVNKEVSFMLSGEHLISRFIVELVVSLL